MFTLENFQGFNANTLAVLRQCFVRDWPKDAVLILADALEENGYQEVAQEIRKNPGDSWAVMNHLGIANCGDCYNKRRESVTCVRCNGVSKVLTFQLVGSLTAWQALVHGERQRVEEDEQRALYEKLKARFEPKEVSKKKKE